MRRIAGKGSYSTISDAVKLVLNRGIIPLEVTGPVPEGLIEQSQQLWQEACKLASSAVASERLALHGARVAGQESLRELTVLADALALQVDELTTQLGTLQADRDAAEQRAKEAEISLKAMQEILKQLGLKPAKTEVKKDQTVSQA